jgi:hypothetical protein
MLELKVRAGRRSVAPEALPAILGARRAYEELGDLVEMLIAQMDILVGDPDLEPNGDEQDTSFVEWHTRGSHKLTAAGFELFDAAGEDGEDDDPDTCVEDDPLGIDPEVDCCAAGDDAIIAGNPFKSMLLWAGADAGPGSDDDEERDQLLHDVPMLPVVSADVDMKTGERVYLGISNLMSTFIAGGKGERSADSGRRHINTATPRGRKFPNGYGVSDGHPV